MAIFSFPDTANSKFGDPIGAVAAQQAAAQAANIARNSGTPAGIQPGQSKSTQQSQSGQYFQDPNTAAGLTNLLSGVSGTAGSYYGDYLRNPAQSPLFTAQLGTLLTSLQPSEAASRTALSDEFRKAGALNSGAFAKAATQNESDILGNREKLSANLLGQSFGPTLQALLGGIGQANPLLSNLKFNQSTSTGSSESQQQAPTPGGGGSVGISGGNFNTGIFGSQYQPAPPAYSTTFSGGGGGSPGPAITPDLANYNYGNPVDYYGGTPSYSENSAVGGDYSGWY